MLVPELLYYSCLVVCQVTHCSYSARLCSGTSWSSLLEHHCRNRPKYLQSLDRWWPTINHSFGSFRILSCLPVWSHLVGYMVVLSENSNWSIVDMHNPTLLRIIKIANDKDLVWKRVLWFIIQAKAPANAFKHRSPTDVVVSSQPLSQTVFSHKRSSKMRPKSLRHSLWRCIRWPIRNLIPTDSFVA